MSCNGCRVLRKGCNENCILRQSLQGIQSPQAQSNATVFVAKFFGRSGLMSFISAVPDSQRSALLQSLLVEACGRTVNPVTGAAGLLMTGNWHVCQSAVETVLRGGTLRALPEFLAGAPASDDASESSNFDLFRSVSKEIEDVARSQPTDLDLRLMAHRNEPRMTAGGRVHRRSEKRRQPNTASINSEESETTTLASSSTYYQRSQGQVDPTLLRLFF